MKRKILVILIALAMLVTLTPTAAFADTAYSEDEPWLEGDTYHLESGVTHLLNMYNVDEDAIEVTSVTSSDPDVIFVEHYGDGKSLYSYGLNTTGIGTAVITVNFLMDGVEKTVSAEFTVKPFSNVITGLSIDGVECDYDTYTDRNSYDVYGYEGTSPVIKLDIADGWGLSIVPWSTENQDGQNFLPLDDEYINNGWTLDFPEDENTLEINFNFQSDGNESYYYCLRLHRESGIDPSSDEPYIYEDYYWLEEGTTHSVGLQNVNDLEIEMISVTSSDPEVLYVGYEGDGTYLWQYSLEPKSVGSSVLTVKFMQNGEEITVTKEIEVKAFPTVITGVTINGTPWDSEEYKTNTRCYYYDYEGTSLTLKLDISEDWYLYNAEAYNNDVYNEYLDTDDESITEGWTIDFPEESEFVAVHLMFSNNDNEYIDFTFFFYPPEPTDGLEWSIDENGTLTISGEGPMMDYDSVTAPWREESVNIKSIVIEPGVTAIGNEAFNYFYSLTSVSLPEGLVSIGDCAFEDCYNLSEISLPASLEHIGESAFRQCEFKSISVDPENSYFAVNGGVLFSKDMTKLIIYPSGNEENTEYVIPDGVEIIADMAFQSCRALESIAIPDSVTVIGYSAFEGCFALADIDLPSGLESIGEDAFYWCSELKEISLPASLKQLGNSVFSGSGVETLTVDPANEYFSAVDNVLFNKDQTELVNYPGGLEAVSYRIPDTVTSIREYAFYGNKTLQKLIIGTGLKELSEEDIQYMQKINCIQFLGDAPKFSDYCFEQLHDCNIYYPSGNATWTEDVRQDYGGYNITWIEGEPKSGWIKEDGGWRYYDNSGDYRADRWLKDSGEWYHFGADGFMQTGWQDIGLLSRYYFDEKGHMVTGKQTIDGETYNFDEFGRLITEEMKQMAPAGLYYYVKHFDNNPETIGVHFYQFYGDYATDHLGDEWGYTYEGLAPCAQLGWFERGSAAYTKIKKESYDISNSIVYRGETYYISGGSGDVGPDNDYEHFGDKVTVYDVVYTIYEDKLVGENGLTLYPGVQRSDGKWYLPEGELDPTYNVHVHSLKHVEAAEATCTEDGNIEYWTCADCGKIYSDAEGTKEITLADTVVKAKGHTPVVDPAVAPACETAGLTEGSHCSVCNKVLTAQQTVPALGHDWSEWAVIKEATTTEEGIERRTCLRDGAHFEERAIPRIVYNGWKQLDGYWYYFDNGTMVTNKWMKDSKGWCWLQDDGKMLTNGWAKDSKGYCWIGPNGYMLEKTQWIDDNGTSYYIKSGYRAVNCWANDGKGWLYLGSDGQPVTNTWKKDSKGWCYVGADGYMITNDWAKDSKGWCWIAADGYMPVATKWIQKDSKWYHITKGYRDENKWMKDSKGWCWLQADGKMLTNGWAKDSKGWCWIAANGYMPTTTQWIKYDGGWYYIEKGYRVQNAWRKDSKGWCYLGAEGRMVTNDFVKDSKGWCWIGEDGYMLVETKVLYLDNGTYGIRDGYMVINGSIEIDGTVYVFGNDGKLITVGM